MPKNWQGIRDHQPTCHEPCARPASRLPFARVVLPVRARDGRALARVPGPGARARPGPPGDVRAGPRPRPRARPRRRRRRPARRAQGPARPLHRLRRRRCASSATRPATASPTCSCGPRRTRSSSACATPSSRARSPPAARRRARLRRPRPDRRRPPRRVAHPDRDARRRRRDGPPPHERAAHRRRRAPAHRARARRARVRPRRLRGRARQARGRDGQPRPYGPARPDRQALLDEAVALVTGTLDVTDCAIVELVEGGGRVRLAASTGTGVDPEADPEDLPAADRLLTGWIVAGDKPVNVWEWASERRFDGGVLRERGVRSTAAAAIRGRTGAFGTIVVHAPRIGTFSKDDAHWLQSMADLLASALDRDESEARVRHQSLHDALTGLPNRSLFYDRIGQAFARSQRSETHVAVLFSTSTSSRRSTTRSATRPATSCSSRSAPPPAARHPRRGHRRPPRRRRVRRPAARHRVRAPRRSPSPSASPTLWERPIPVGTGGEIFVSASIGITIATRPQSAETMLRDADARDVPGEGARPRPLRAVRRGDARATPSRACGPRATCAAPSSASSSACTTSRSSTSPSERLAGVEALVRWHRPAQRDRRPRRVHRPHRGDRPDRRRSAAGCSSRPCAQVAEWRERDPHAAALALTVNVSGAPARPPRVPRRGRGRAGRAACRPRGWCLEITESLLMNATPPRSTLDGAPRLRRARLAVDDFGTGYSSLRDLQPACRSTRSRSTAPSSTASAAEDEDTAIVSAIVDIASSLGLSAIAEGVETRAQLDAAPRARLRRRAGLPLRRADVRRRVRGPPRRRRRAAAQRGRLTGRLRASAPCRRPRRSCASA